MNEKNGNIKIFSKQVVKIFIKNILKIHIIVLYN